MSSVQLTRVSVLKCRRRRGPALLAAMVYTLAMGAVAGENFTLVSTEENTKDMSVNLAVDAFRSEEILRFGGERIATPVAAASRETLISLLNHDSGVLDVQHTFLRLAPLASRALLQFETLREELNAHCWSKEQASQLRATLRMYVIPPNGPQKHNRLLGISPTTWMPPAVGVDFPPASVSVGVFRQPTAWVEGPGQNSFIEFFDKYQTAVSFAATASDEAAQEALDQAADHYRDLLIDTVSVGVLGKDTRWGGKTFSKGVDVCLNRLEGRVVEGTGDNRAMLCFDEDPNWQPWVDFDVSDAIRYWMESDFAPDKYHGFTFYQWQPPQDDAASDSRGQLAWVRGHQVRITPEVPGLARSRAVISFASSSGAADCRGAGGLWGGPSQADTTYANLLCMTAGDELEPNPLGSVPANVVPRFVEPSVHPEWTPRLVIEGLQGDGQCPASAAPPSRAVDAQRGEATPVEVSFRNQSDGPLTLLASTLTESTAFEISNDGCASGELSAQQECIVELQLSSDELGSHQAEVEIHYRMQSDEFAATVTVAGTVSEDGDGIPDSVENRGPNGGDSNDDGIPDRRQSQVAAFRNSAGDYITLQVEGAERVRAVEQLQLPIDSEIGLIQFDDGFYQFELTGVTASRDVRVSLSGIDARASVYYVYGRRGAGSEVALTQFEFDGTSGAEFDSTGMTLNFRDGAWGDADEAVDGRISVLAGGPGKIDAVNFRLVNPTVGAFSPWWLVFACCGTGFVVATSFVRRRRRA